MDVDVDVGVDGVEGVEGMEGIIKEGDAVIAWRVRVFGPCTPVCRSRGHIPASSPPSAPFTNLITMCPSYCKSLLPKNSSRLCMLCLPHTESFAEKT